MIKIFGPRQSSAARCMWTMEELGLQYEVVPVNMQTGEHKTPEFLKMNPNGKVPVMVDGDLVLYESMAINFYLCGHYDGGMLLGDTDTEKGLVLQWSFWVATQLASPFELVVVAKWRQIPEGDAHKVAREEITKYLTVLEGQLAGKDYLVANKFTLADLHVVSVVANVSFIGFDMVAYPNISAYVARCAARDAYIKARG